MFIYCLYYVYIILKDINIFNILQHKNRVFVVINHDFLSAIRPIADGIFFVNN